MKLVLALTLILSKLAFSYEGSRKPSNYMPDDDLIVIPLYIEEKSFIKKVQEEHVEDFKESKRIVQTWILNEEFARDHGLDGRGIIPESTVEQRQNFLNRNFLRYFSKRAEKNVNSGIKDWWEGGASDEIDAIDHQEKRSKYAVVSEKSKTVKKLTKSQDVKVGREKLKIGFQPRVEMGALKVTAEGFGFNARLWVGVNTSQEVYVEKRFELTNTRILGNYYFDEKKLLAAIDQPLFYNIDLRITHQKDYDSNLVRAKDESKKLEDNTIQFRYYLGF